MVLRGLRAHKLAEHAVSNAQARSVGRVKDAETRVAEQLNANQLCHVENGLTALMRGARELFKLRNLVDEISRNFKFEKW